MFVDLVPFYPLLVPFLLVLFRVMGMFVFTPFFSHISIPVNVKVLLAVALTVCVWSSIPHSTGAILPDSLISLVLAVMAELSVGLLIGMMTLLLFTGVQIGGQLVSQQMGLSMSAIYDPTFEGQSTAIEQFAFWLTLMVFFAIGGHRELINTLVHSYTSVPLGVGISAENLLNIALGSVMTAFHLAIKVAAPALVAFFLSSLAMGFASKSMPQMNVMVMVTSVHLLVGFGMIMLSLVAWAAVCTHAFADLFAMLARIFATGH